MDCSCNHNRSGKMCIELVSIFNTLTYDEMMEIARITVSRKYAKGQMIYMAGDRGKSLFVIHKGKVKVSRISDSGKEQVIRVLGPGDFMGELSLFIHHPCRQCRSLGGYYRLYNRWGKLKNLMVKYPTIALKIVEELSSRLERAENLIEYLGIHDVETRIIETLLNMADEKGVVTLKVSKKDLASHIGMSQETLSRKLSYFQELGLIEQIGHRKIVILDEEGLRKLT